MNTEKLYAVIVAGGSGTRMEHSVPKQFICLSGLPILMHTINAFKRCDDTIKIFLVLPKVHIDYWTLLCDEHKFAVRHTVVEGGSSRGESVVRGLIALPEEGIVAIHDGVRPFVSSDTIQKSFISAQQHGSGVACVDLKDSIRELTSAGSKSVDRENFKIVQTPQTFKISLIKEAYRLVGNLQCSDDATVAEIAGYKIDLIMGSYDNIKITTREDLIVAQEILKKL